MPAPLTHPERVAVARLHAMLELLPTALDKRLSEAGVTAFEHTLLDELARSDSHRLRLSELARQTNATLPRLSRVASSLERRGLIERVPCAEDGRATNAVLTAAGARVREVSLELYEQAVRDLVFTGLDRLPGDGVAQLTDLTYAVLTSLDPDHSRTRAVLGKAETACDADPAPECPADPEPECPADPAAPLPQATHS